MEEPPSHLSFNSLENDNQHLEEEEFISDFGMAVQNGKAIDNEVIEKEKLRNKLRFFFMNPLDKWRMKRKFPYKLLILLLKIILVTVQLSLFAHHRASFIDYVFHSGIVFNHLFLQGWDSSWDAYPPPSGDFVIYRSKEFYSAIDFGVINYVNLHETAVGSYSYIKNNETICPMKFCIRQFKEFAISDSDKTFYLNDTISVDCIDIEVADVNSNNFSSANLFRERNLTVKFSSMVDAHLSFGIRTVNFKFVPPECLQFNVSIDFDNEANDGRFKLGLNFVMDRLECKGNNTGNNAEKSAEKSLKDLMVSVLNFLVIILCLLSGILCMRAIWRAQLLRWKTNILFKKLYDKNLTWEDNCEFINLWYVTMIASDLLILIGSAMKERIENNNFDGDEWNICGLILGIGNFLVWFSILRYLCFFKTYNAIIITLKVAAPAMFRFMVCVVLIYMGFTFCGWLVLGPYHEKFRTLYSTSECLFALLNGDDVFATFTMLKPTNSNLIWWFSRIYLYTFISLFIYVVLSLFLSILVDAYEVIKHHELSAFPKSDVKKFIEARSEGDLSSIASSSLADHLLFTKPKNLRLRKVSRIFCCCSNTSLCSRTNS